MEKTVLSPPVAFHLLLSLIAIIYHAMSRFHAVTAAAMFFSFLQPCFAFRTDGTGALRGFITDSTTGEAVVYANVLVKGTTRGATANVRGYYLVPALAEGKHTIRISRVGYRTREFNVTIADDEITQLNVALVPFDIRLDEMLVTHERPQHPAETDLGLKRITTREVQMTPSGFEADIPVSAQQGILHQSTTSVAAGAIRTCFCSTAQPCTIPFTRWASTALSIRK